MGLEVGTVMFSVLVLGIYYLGYLLTFFRLHVCYSLKDFFAFTFNCEEGLTKPSDNKAINSFACHAGFLKNVD